VDTGSFPAAHFSKCISKQMNRHHQHGRQSTGLVKTLNSQAAGDLYKHVILIDNTSGKMVLLDNMGN
jgi:hypothetical protein